MAVSGVKNNKAGSPDTAEGGGNLDLSKDELKAAPDAQDAIEHATDDPATGTTNPTNEDELSMESNHPILVAVGGSERHLFDVVKEAKKESGMSTKEWNALDRRERTAEIDKVLAPMRAEAQKELDEARAGQTTGDFEQQDVRVHETRGVGGRFVAIGAGERVRVAEASQAPDAPILSDEDLAAQAGA